MVPALITLGALLLLLILVVLIRTLTFTPPVAEVREYSKIELDENKIAENLAAMIRCKTISNDDKKMEDEAEFDKFKALLTRLFPNVYATCELENVSDRALLFRWRGKSENSPTVLMAHFDVVSVVEENWDKPAFDGIIEDGIIWGRGVIDTKGSLNGILCAAEQLISEGFTPERDVYFALGGDEEINGDGAAAIVRLFVERGIDPGLVLDEGGAVVNDVFPGVKAQCAVVGIGEKGLLNAEYSVSGGGGHSSAPAPHTPVGRLSAACVRVENHPFKFRLTEPTRRMFNTLGRHSTFVYRMIFSNLWLFSPVLNLIAKKSGGQINAIARTTVAFTQMEGSKGINVIPPYARMVSNSRILPGETVEGTLERIKKTVDDDGVEVRIINGRQPSKLSRADGEAWERLNAAIGDNWQGVIVSPYLMTACSDAKHWNEISDKVYRFSPFTLSKEENSTVHGNNERLPVSTAAKCVEFYIRLIKRS